MSLEENKAVVCNVIEAENKKDLALLDEFIALDFIEGRGTPFELRGLESYKKFEDMFIKSFPDCLRTIEEIIAEGDKVWILEKVEGTHTGEWNLFGIIVAPTGKKVTYTVVTIYRIVDGKIVERKSIRDMLDFLQQLGVIEYTEKAKRLFPKNVE